MTPSPRLVAVLVVLLLGTGRGSAAPRDELLRLAPPDAALVLVAQNARDHLKQFSESPFAAWFPTTPIGKQLLGSADFQKAHEGSVEVLRQLGTTPEELLNDVFGDAIVFAFTPGSADNKTADRSVILIRPRNFDTLQKLIDRLNDHQKQSGELKAVVSREYKAAVYFERQRATEPSEFYFLRGGVFAFAESEADIRAVIDREQGTNKAPELADRLTRLGVSDAAVVLLINPRAFDADVRSKVAGANRDETAALAKFAEVWAALDAVAVYLGLGRDLEAGAVLRFRPDGLPAALQPWIVGPRTPSGLWSAVPKDALFAAAGRVKVSELIDTLGAVVPADGKNRVRAGVEKVLGSVIDRDKLPAVLDALGPDWAIWAAPPAAGDGFLPVGVAALQVRAEGPGGPAAVEELAKAVEFGFRAARFAYNMSHADQIDLREAKDGDVVIRSLVNNKAFPAGFRPSFALKNGYLLLATSPDAIKAFRAPATPATPGGEVPLARFSGTAARAYLLAHREPLAKFLSGAGAGPEQEVLTNLDQFAAVLELFDRVELLARGDATTYRVILRVSFAKPLKK
jgi:hypothetical protein